MMKILISKLKFPIITTIILVSFTGTNFCQNVQPKDVVNISTAVVKDSLKTNSLIYVDIILNIKEGWHINANKPLDDYSTPTVVTFNNLKNFELQKIKYPLPSIMKLNFSETELALYEDQVTIHVVFKAKDLKELKDKTIKGKLQYQPCNNQTCLFPVTKPFELKLDLKSKNYSN